jgi:NodT family efflux transporter outer membrane factor (OMF) lipoprotein
MIPATTTFGGGRAFGGGAQALRRGLRVGLASWAVLAVLCLCGCTSPGEYIRNGFKVGPNYQTPPAAVAPDWIDAADQRVRREGDDLSKWWAVFNDPVLNRLIDDTYRQNLTLRQARQRVLEARAQLGIAVGNLFPQQQSLNGSLTQTALSAEDANVHVVSPFGPVSLQRFYSQWSLPIGALSWEIDFWGRFRRAVEADTALLDASVANYQDVLVTLFGDVAASYVAVRTLEKQIEYTRTNADLQRQTLKIVEARFKAGTVTGVDLRQARSTLAQTESQIPELEILLRQTQNRLCTLLGIPPEDLAVKLGPAPIPTAPPEVAVGIPADLLRRRPDVRRAERLAAAQSAEIGIAEADFYPAIFINGTIGYSAQQFKDLWRSSAFTGSVGPSFHWNILNYGRILNGVRLERAKFEEAVANYQETVLKANQEVEDGLVTFLKAQQRARFLNVSVDEALEAVKLVLVQYEKGTVDFTRVTQLQLTLVQQQDDLAQAQGEIARGLVQVYKGLGGGWEYRPADQDHGARLGQPRALEPCSAPAPVQGASGAPVHHYGTGPQVTR